jgi:hypothetical protein
MPSLTAPQPTFGPTDFHVFTGLKVPDPITFALCPQWLNRPQLYPRQATLLKVIFLRNDLLTEYDHVVIDEWEESFRRTGDNGIVPNVRQRMAALRLQGYFYFREVLLVLGRRAGKGYISGIAMAYVLWCFMAKGDPQGHYGVDRDKQLACFVYAGKKQQARENLWKDLSNIITGAPCFTRYISRPLTESLTVFAPHDFVRLKKLRSRGIKTERDMATFLIEPKEATLMSGRGPASFMQGYDEMAHVVASSGSSQSAEAVYGAATPALDQFKKDAFIIDPSSPWQMIGQFYTNWKMSLELNEETGEPEHPYMLMLQLASWEIYYDWEEAHQLPVFPEDFRGDLDEYAARPHPRLAQLKGSIQEFDERMEKLEKGNPEKFAVERRSKWQAVIDAYLDPKKVKEIFDHDRLMTTEARNLTTFYKGHADPSKVNDNFAVAVAHEDMHEDGFKRCVFDYIHHWPPSEFEGNTIDYIYVVDRLYDLAWGFKTDEFTFDQHNSAMPIQQLITRVRKAKPPKRMQVFEQTATATHNWEVAECFKVAINQGWVDAPYYETAELELTFLQRKSTATTNRVVHQDTGPVIHDDVAKAMMECVWRILGDQVNAWAAGAMSDFKLEAMGQGGFNPYSRMESPDADLMNRLSPRNRTMVRGGGLNPARNVHRRGRR